MNSSTDKYNQHSRERSEHLIRGKEKNQVANEVSTLWGKKDKKNIMFARIREKIRRRKHGKSKKNG